MSRRSLSSVALLGLQALALLWLAACEIPPRFVEETSQIDGYILRQSWSSACVGLQMKSDDKLRRYTAEQLAQHPFVKAATSCVCEAMYDAEAHAVDFAVADGAAGTKRDDLAECLSGALDDTAIEGADRANLVRVLGAIHAPKAFELLERLATDDGDAAVRAYATEALTPSKRSTGVLLDRLKNDEAPEVRAAAASALGEQASKELAEPLLGAATEDPDGRVRAAAIPGVVRLKHARRDDVICAAMIDDEDEAVRDAAVKAFHGTKRADALDCLDKRLRKLEESATVRASLLAALSASPSKKATDILCDGIGPFLRLHVTDKIAETIPAINILETQNNRDFERSLECAQRALAQGGYSCYARNHLGHWIKQLGGSAATPWCPGMERE